MKRGVNFNNYRVSMKKFITIFLFLMTVEVITTAIWYNRSVDVRWWWPFALLFSSLLWLLYGGLFLLIEKIRPMSYTYAIVFNSLLAIVVLVVWIAYYFLKTDWLAFNEWREKLTWLESLVYNDKTLYAIPLVFLAVHLCVVLYSKYFKK